METIIRKTLLYKSGLNFYCINHALGCSHGCSYPCYAYMMAHTHGRIKTYNEWCQPKLVANAEELLSKELSKMKRKPVSIHLCLTTDPFMMGYPEVTNMSLKLIALINSHGINCSILTKGILPADLADRNRFPADNTYGISLVSLDENFRRLWEPNAAPYIERINALKYLKNNERQTLVHIEPYPTPNIVNQNIEKLLEAVSFTDQIFFSGWNYSNRIRQFSNYHEFYKEQANLVRQFCSKHKIYCETGI